MSSYALQQPITQSDIDYAHILYQQGKLGEMYDFLASHGDRYSILAKGVVTEDTLSGRAAIEYLEHAALSQGKTLTESDKLAVKTAMAGKYLDTLQGIIDQSESGEVSREITASEAQALHDSAFGELGYGSDAWTLTTPFKIFGESGAQSYWEQTLGSAGNPFAEISNAAWMIEFMDLASSLAPFDKKQEINAWRGNFENLDAISGIATTGVADLYDFSRGWFADFLEAMGGISGILDSAHDFWFGSRSWVQRRDPLTLDLDGDGLETVGIDSGRLVYFDHNGDGVKTATGWVGSDDGFLVLDRNGNGTIDSGAELFGDSTVLADGSTAADGFAALAEQDTNGDGVVDANDTGWGDLRVWRDLNQNGISEAGRMFKTLCQPTSLIG
ncbi:MAG: hypothetical protein AB7V33_00910 [Halothiobacillus sp.]|uniref:hypothetical protein n=1 Tax=Sulfuricurvum sp. TaxID=2025608 RepID=UPI003D0FEADD